MPYSNVHRVARISPRKARLIMDMIRHKTVEEAQIILQTSKNRAAVLIDQSLTAAIANADQDDANIRGLRVIDARADAGPTIKRFQPKDRGRAHPIKKRTSHLTVSVG